MSNNATNPFDDAAASVMHQDAQATAVQIRNNVQFAVGQSPDQAAQYQHLAKYVGVPVETVQAQPEAIKQQAALKSMDADKLVNDYPTLAKYLIDPNNVAKSHDDIAPLAAVEQATKALPGPVPTAKPPSFGDTVTGLPMDVLKGLSGSFNKAAGSVNYALGAFPSVYDKVAGLMTGNPTTAAGDAWYRSMVAPRVEAQHFFEPAADAPFASKAASTVGNLVGMLSQIVLTGAGGAAPSAAGTTAEVIGNQMAHGAKAMTFPAITDSLDTGRRVYAETGDANAALRAAQMQYASTTAAGVVPLSAPGGLATRAAGGFASGAASGETSRNAMNLVLPTSMQQPFDVEGMLLSGLSGSMLGSVMGPRATPVYHDAIQQTYRDAGKAEAAEKGMAALQGLSELAAASKTRERDPEGFKAFVKSATEDGQLREVYVDANALAEVLNQSGVTIDALAKTMPEVAAQFHQAVQTNGDIRIPVEDYATHIAGGKIDAALLPHLKVEPDGFTHQQGQEYFQNQQADMKAQAEKILASKADDDAAQLDAQVVHDKVLDQLNANGRFRPEVNTAYAAMTRDFYVTMAERAGMTPSELYAAHPLKITSEALTGGKGLEQGSAVAIEQTGDYLAAKSEAGQVGGNVTDGALRIHFAEVDAAHQGKGEGVRLYTALVDKALARGLKVFSDSAVEAEAVRMYEALQRRGYEVRRLDGGTLEDGAAYGKSGQPAFEVLAGKVLDQSAAGTTEFKVWFGDSKVVDAKGEPLVVYHGGADGITEFKNHFVRNAAFLTKEARANLVNTNFFTSSKAVAKSYLPKVGRDGAKTELYETYLRLENPLVADMAGATYRGGNVEGRIQEAVAAGHDGMILKNMVDDYTRKGKPADIYVAFKSEQIKSATGNDGSFDANDPSILSQGKRGGFNPDTGTISLLRGADLSTYLHESGHFFLETMHDMASTAGAPEGIKADFDTLLASFGEPGATPEQRMSDWTAKTLGEKRDGHEQFARSFEAYLMEGKAPSLELQPLFSRFRSWLVNIYKSLSNLNVELTPEVRGVMDRLLASDEAIRHAEQARSYLPLTAAPEGTTAEQFAAYQALGKEATEQAVTDMTARSLRDMQWAGNAKGRVMRELQKQADTQRKAIREEVAKELEAEPVERARKWLTKGVMEDAEGAEIKAEKGFRLNSDVIKEMFPETALGQPDLSKLRGMTAKEGLHPDMVADMFGFDSGEALVHDLIESTGKLKDQIDGTTDQRMLERHGELIDAASIERAAEAAIHNEARARFMATGLKMLSKSPIPARQLAEAAKQAAEKAIADKRVRDLRPAQHAAEEARANRDAIKLAPKDPQGAVQAQRAALLNNRLFKAATDALAEVAKGVAYLKRLERVPAQSKMRGEFLEQVNTLLERFDLRTSAPAADVNAARVPLAEWVAGESERLSAVVPDLPGWIMNEGTRTSFKNLRVEEFRGLIDAVKQLEMLARREQKQYMAIRAMEFATERGAVLDRIREFNPKAFDPEGEPIGILPDFVPSLRKSLAKMGGKFTGEFLNAETILNVLEGGQFGQVHESLFGRMSERADWKATRLGDIYKEMKPLFKQYSLAERVAYSRKDIGSAIGVPLTRENALVVALLHGNAEGRERLANYGWSEARQQEIIRLLDARDLKLADGIWRMFDENLWPELKALNDRTRGKAPPKVEALPFPTAHGQARGGYFRLKYDTNLDERAHHLDEAAAVRELLGGGMGMSSKTNQGTSTERKQNVTLRPRLDLGVFAEAVNETVHDLAFREAVADTSRLLNDKGIQNAIKGVAGVPSYRALVTRVREVAAPPRNPSGFIEKAVTIARKNTVVVLMSGVNTALQNFTGLIPALARVNAGHLSVELAKFYGPRMKEMYEFSHSQSEYMRNRHQSFDRDLQTMATQLTVNGKIMPETGTWLALMGMIDKAVSVPVWNAAFKDGMQAHTNDPTAAAAYADHIVRQTQGSGREVDLPAIMSGHGGYGQLKRVFTMFYSYFNGQLGMLVRAGAVNKRLATENPALAVAKFAADFMFIVALPAVLTEMFFSRHSSDEDNKTPEQTAKRYSRALVMYGAGMFPVVRDLASFAWASFDHDTANYGYKISPVQSAGEGLVKAGVSIKDVAEGEGDEKDAKAIIMGVGYATGLPGKLIADTTLGTKAWLEGRAGPEAIAVGPPPRK